MRDVERTQGAGGGDLCLLLCWFLHCIALQQRFGISKSRMISSDFGGQSKRREGDKVV